MKRNKKFVVFLLVVVMFFTTAISYVFWTAGGLAPESQDQVLSVTIGEGNQVETEITLNSDMTAGQTLIPGDVVPTGDETHEIIFTIDTFWGGETSELYGQTGVLDVMTTAIMINDLNFLDVTGLGDVQSLFNVQISPEQEVIVANSDTPIPVEVTISMIQPRDREQFLQVSGETLSLNIQFAVTPDGEL